MIDIDTDEMDDNDSDATELPPNSRNPMVPPTVSSTAPVTRQERDFLHHIRNIPSSGPDGDQRLEWEIESSERQHEAQGMEDSMFLMLGSDTDVGLTQETKSDEVGSGWVWFAPVKAIVGEGRGTVRSSTGSGDDLWSRSPNYNSSIPAKSWRFSDYDWR